MKIYIGIDPGKKGAIARISVNEGGAIPIATVHTVGIPLIDTKTYDFDGIMHVLFGPDEPHGYYAGAAVERLTALPMTMGGGKANFARGESLAWEWLLRSRGIPVVRPLPQQWQKRVFLGPSSGEDTKTRSILEVQRRWPGVNLQRTPRSRNLDDGFADAIHLAQYAKDHFGGQR